MRFLSHNTLFKFFNITEIDIMRKWLMDLDRVLRGEATQLSALRNKTIEVQAQGLTCIGLILAVLYGICMGSFAIFRPDNPIFMQMAASAVKVPLLFFLTLLVTVPSLYVSNALIGSRLRFLALFRLLTASVAVNIAVLASLGPVVAFFSVTTTSYSFMVLLNVLVFAVAGGIGVAFLLQTLHRLSLVLQTAMVPDGVEADSQDNECCGILHRPDDRRINRNVKHIVHCWVVMFALVGAQMAWVLRPFIGSPSSPFEWFRARGSNFFEAVLHTFFNLFS